MHRASPILRLQIVFTGTRGCSSESTWPLRSSAIDGAAIGAHNLHADVGVVSRDQKEHDQKG